MADQRPIQFGGVDLSALPEHVIRRYEESTPVDLIAEEYWGLKPGPAGEETREARVVAVSRAALAARLKHGVPMSELVSHFTTLAIAEGLLLK